MSEDFSAPLLVSLRLVIPNVAQASIASRSEVEGSPGTSVKDVSGLYIQRGTFIITGSEGKGIEPPLIKKRKTAEAAFLHNN